MDCYFDITIEGEEPFPRISSITYCKGSSKKTFIIDTPQGSYYQEAVGDNADYVFRTFIKDISSCDTLTSDNTEYKILCIKRELESLGVDIEIKIPLIDIIKTEKVKKITGGHLTLEQTYEDIFEIPPKTDRLKMMKDIVNL